MWARWACRSLAWRTTWRSDPIGRLARSLSAVAAATFVGSWLAAILCIPHLLIRLRMRL